MDLKSKTIWGIVFYKFSIFILFFNKFGMICILTGSFFHIICKILNITTKALVIPQDYMHTEPRLQALNNFNFGSKDQRYKKEGPDPYKGSYQLQVEILNKRG